MRFLIVGCGSIGRRHLRNLCELGYTDLLVYRSQRKNVEEIEQEFGVTSFFDLDQALAESPDVVIIANPTACHVSIALAAARAECHLFIEKPVSHSMNQVKDLMRAVASNGLIAAVGYNLRFHNGLVRMRELLQNGIIGRPVYVRSEAGSYLPDWRPGRDYRKVYSANSEQGGGVVLDLSHELDYLLWLFGPVSYVTSVIGTLGGLKIDAEDTSEILLEHTNGMLSSLHLDYLQRTPTRCCKVVGTEGTLAWDYYAGILRSFDLKRDCWESHRFREAERNSIYLEELRHFIACVEKRERPLVSLEEGVRVLQVALTAKEAARCGRRQEVDYVI